MSHAEELERLQETLGKHTEELETAKASLSSCENELDVTESAVDMQVLKEMTTLRTQLYRQLTMAKYELLSHTPAH